MVLAPMTTADLAGLVASVGAMAAAVDDADRIERVRQFEALTAACAAAQAAVAADFDRSQRAAQAAAGVPVARQGRGVAAQVALARRVSPWQAQRWLGWAKILTSELPGTYAELAAGRTSQWRATLVARESAMLSREDRAAVDRDLAPHLAGWGDRRVEAETRKAAYRLDPAGAVARARNAETDRRVTIRSAPDTMCRLSALLPVAQGVGAYAALKAEADRLVGTGDGRSRGQVMADTLVQRLTGQATATAVPVEINLVISDDTFLRGGDEPAWLHGYGPVPAGWARDLATNHPHPTADGNADTHSGAHAAGADAPRWIRRLYTRHRRLVALDSHRRRFTPGQQRFLHRRDQTCRTPWCDAPIRHTDHIRPHGQGGPTHVDNGQGLCEACNHARQALHWHATVHPDGTITTHTPTGHTYTSRLPMTTGPPVRTPLEHRLAQLIDAA